MSTVTKPRGLNEVLGDITAGAQRVSIATRSWPAFLPKVSSLDDVANTQAGLQRSVAELRNRVEADAQN